MKSLIAIIAIIAIALAMAACAQGSPTSQPGDETPSGSAVFIETADLLILESYPVQIMLHVTGNLPTPCHSFHYAYQVGSTSDPFRIDVTAWSEADPTAMCTQVLQPFDERISLPMSGAADGTFGVYINGEFVAEFSYPG